MNNYYVAVGDELIVKYSSAVCRRLLYRSLLYLIIMTDINNATGMLIGLAVGDAVGTTVEFRKRGCFQPVTAIFKVRKDFSFPRRSVGTRKVDARITFGQTLTNELSRDSDHSSFKISKRV